LAREGGQIEIKQRKLMTKSLIILHSQWIAPLIAKTLEGICSAHSQSLSFHENLDSLFSLK
jgi:hypothetical protein